MESRMEEFMNSILPLPEMQISMVSPVEEFMYNIPPLPQMQDISASSSVNIQNFPLMSFATGTTKPHPSSRYQAKIYSKECLCRQNIQWTWDHHYKNEHIEILDDNVEVRFNKRCSTGTAVVRCSEPMSSHQYYWEVKMTYPVYGTDIMVGVGTSEAAMDFLPDRYVSRLGMDEQTWGFSCHGLFHHKGERRYYAQSFGQGNVIGVHLDLWRGTLSFYKDRKYLGVACSGLKDKTLYAMASSTAACSGMRIVRSCSFPSSLQFLCAVKLREIIPHNKNVLDIIDIPPGLKQFLRTNLNWLLDRHDLQDDFKTCCAANNAANVDKMDYEPSVSSRDVDLCSAESMRFPIAGSSQNIPRRNSVTVTGSVNRNSSPERSTKRSRTSYHYTFDLSDDDSD